MKVEMNWNFGRFSSEHSFLAEKPLLTITSLLLLTLKRKQYHVSEKDFIAFMSRSFFLSYYLTVPWPSLGYYRRDNLTHQMLIIAFLQFKIIFLYQCFVFLKKLLNDKRIDHWLKRQDKVVPQRSVIIAVKQEYVF